MPNRLLNAVPVALVVLVVPAASLDAQTPTPTATTQKTVPKVKSAAAVPIVSIEGKDNFAAYCAVCHGADAKGQGPAAPAKKAVVPDLTTIASRNGGKFDAIRVEDIVRGSGKTATPAHGVETMPVWGDVFKSEDPARATLRVKNLVKFLESIQAPATSARR